MHLKKKEVCGELRCVLFITVLLVLCFVVLRDIYPGGCMGSKKYYVLSLASVAFYVSYM